MTELSLQQAIEFAIQNNLATLLAAERSSETSGVATQALSRLLPTLSGAVSQANRTVNLRAQGINIPGAPTFVGPFNTFDARLRLAQTLFDLSKFRSYQAGQAGIDVARWAEQSARQQVATAAELTYVEALRARQAVVAAQADLELADSLLKLARDQHDAGIATGIDVARAATRVSQNRLALAQSNMAARQASLQIQRTIGLPQGAPLTLTDALRFLPETPVSPEQAIATANENRSELRVAEHQVRQLDLEREATVAEQYPTLQLNADYGGSGITPVQEDLATRGVSVQLSVPIFEGGLMRGRIDAATSRKRQAALQLNDTRGQVEEDVRLALVMLDATAEQVRAADETLRLSERLLQLARDRFMAGVGDNIEVVDAQTALATARNGQVAALAAYNTARVNLAATQGRAEAFRL